MPETKNRRDNPGGGPAPAPAPAAAVIKDHEDHLIRRVIGRNTLLRFFPTGKKRLDISEMLPAQYLLPAEAAADSGYCNTSREFLNSLFAENKARLRIDDPQTARALGNIGKIAGDYQRTTGVWPVVLAWPFVWFCHEGKTVFAPLFTQGIRFKFNGSIAEFTFGDEKNKVAYEMERNFVLDPFLRHKEIGSLNLSDAAMRRIRDGGALEDKVARIREWLPDMTFPGRNVDAGEFDSDISRCPASGVMPDGVLIRSSAVIGMADFKYQSLLGDLRKLKGKAGMAPALGLLKHFLPGENRIDDSAGVKPPDEKGKWLVEQTDPSQEQAIWSRRGKSPIMQLKGPPGTGKSQTIVNIVADALRQKSGVKRVAVVCHHRAALTVVQKRLSAIGLGHLTVLITSPKEQRGEIIQSIRAIPDEEAPLIAGGEDGSQERERHCQRIREQEGMCHDRDFYSRDIYLDGQNGQNAYSTQGHWRAIIHRTHQDIRYHPQANPKNQKFSDIVEAFLDGLDAGLSLQGKEKTLLGVIDAVTEDWDKCNYPENPWRAIGRDEIDDGALARLRLGFQDLIDKTNALLSFAGGEPLPVNQTLSLAGHPALARFYAGVVPPSRRDVIKQSAEIAIAARELFNGADMPFLSELREKLVDIRNIGEYQNFADTIPTIRDVQKIKAQIAENHVIGYLSQRFRDVHKDWRKICHATICGVWLRKHMPRQLLLENEYRRAKNVLKESLGEKRALDVRIIKNPYDDWRLGAAESLKRKALLRLKRHRNIPHTSLRSLFHSGGDDVAKIYPVLLTTPDALSQMLPLDEKSIDLVIVDEASQMFTADAMPLLYRAKKIVISGDKNQMPPSDFFTLADGADDAEGEDDESADATLPRPILPYELMEALEDSVRLPASQVRMLQVHYRSHSEELIAFSNHAFYDGGLLAAPDNNVALPCLGHRPILLKEVPGKFENGQNQLEAQEIIRRLKQIWQADGALSTGVIVFNIKQRDLVLDMLDREAAQDEAFKEIYEKARALKDADEDVGFFVRSVEHVQGDERDIIVLGTTYGSAHRYYGPISRTGLGRRRLNVAVTRAKRGMLIVSSLDIEKISNDGRRPGSAAGDGERQGGEGWYLWKYMQYARAVSRGDKDAQLKILRGINSRYTPPEIGGIPDSEFEVQVGEFLRENGYHVDYQVGESGFRIDLGVKESRDAPRYLCGLECDGRIWHSGWRARHNDIWRQGILEGKGWTILRIWSDEWYGNPKARRELLEEIKALPRP